MRRTPAATAPSPTILKRPISPVRRTWVPPQSSVEKCLSSSAPPMETTRTSSPYFSPKRASAPAFTASSGVMRRVATSALRRMRSLTSVSTARMSSDVSAFGWLKSKRSRSGATSEPFCVTCVPSRRRSASCSRWVAEWLARSAVRRSPSTRSSTTSPTAILPLVTVPRWTWRSPSFFWVSRMAISVPPALNMTPCRPSGRRTRRRTGSDWR